MTLKLSSKSEALKLPPSTPSSLSSLPLPFPTTLTQLNDILKGGIQRETLTELYGAKSTFKTQFILTLAIQIASKRIGVILVDSCSSIHHVRLLQIARNLYPNQYQSILKYLYIVHVTDWPNLTAFVHMLPFLITQCQNAKFIAIDSISTLFRTCNETAPAKRLETLANTLNYIANIHQLSILLINSTTATNPRSEDFITTTTTTSSSSNSNIGDHDTLQDLSAMGSAWRQCIGTRLYIQRERSTTYANGSVSVVKNAFSVPPQLTTVRFQVSEAGITENMQHSM